MGWEVTLRTPRQVKPSEQVPFSSQLCDLRQVNAWPVPQSPLWQNEGALNTSQLSKAGKIIDRRRNRPEVLLLL